MPIIHLKISLVNEYLKNLTLDKKELCLLTELISFKLLRGQFLNFLYPFKLSNTFEKFYSSFEMSIG